MENTVNTTPETKKKRVLSMIQPTGMFTLGNYLGALKNFVALQNDYECVYAHADLHAITVRQEAAQLRETLGARIELVPGDSLTVSSTELRQGGDLHRFTAPAVADYIEREHLYGF